MNMSVECANIYAKLMLSMCTKHWLCGKIVIWHLLHGDVNHLRTIFSGYLLQTRSQTSNNYAGLQISATPSSRCPFYWYRLSSSARFYRNSESSLTNCRQCFGNITNMAYWIPIMLGRRTLLRYCSPVLDSVEVVTVPRASSWSW